MKLKYLIILMLGLPYLVQSQNASITIGRGTNCFGRGACSITTENPNTHNSSIFKNNFGETILRIHRALLSVDEANRILGQPIDSKNSSSLKFEMLESITVPQTVLNLVESNNTKQLSVIGNGRYLTTITKDFIDVTLNSRRIQE